MSGAGGFISSIGDWLGAVANAKGGVYTLGKPECVQQPGHARTLRLQRGRADGEADLKPLCPDPGGGWLAGRTRGGQ